MKRLIFARPKKLPFDKDFRDVITNEDFTDKKIVDIIINSPLFQKLINNKKLSSGEIFNKLIKAKLGSIAKSILRELLLSSDEILKKIQVYNLNEVGKNIIEYIRNNLNNNESNLYKEINLHIYNEFHKSDNKSNDKSDDKLDDKSDDSKTISIDNIDDLKDYLDEKRNTNLKKLLIDIVKKAPLFFICYTEDEIDKLCVPIKNNFLKHYPSGKISEVDLNKFLQDKVISIESLYFEKFANDELPIIKQLIEDLYAYDHNVKIEYNSDLDRDLRLYISTSSLNQLIREKFLRNCKKILTSKFYLDRIGVKQIIKKPIDSKKIQDLTIETICKNKNIKFTKTKLNQIIKSVSTNYKYYFGENDGQQRFAKLPLRLLESIAEHVKDVDSSDQLLDAIKSKMSADDLFEIRQSFIDRLGISDPAVKHVVQSVLSYIFPNNNYEMYRNTKLMKSVANILYNNTQFKNCVFAGLEQTISNSTDLVKKLFLKSKKEKSNNDSPVKRVRLDNLRDMSFQQIRNLPTLPSLKNNNDNIGDQENILLANFYQTKIIISSDGNIKYLPPNNNMQYINELTNKHLNYAIGTITNNGIVCINQNNNMNINDIVNICKKDSQINKIYELNEQHNFAAKIIRRAKLATLLWRKK